MNRQKKGDFTGLSFKQRLSLRTALILEFILSGFSNRLLLRGILISGLIVLGLYFYETGQSYTLIPGNRVYEGKTKSYPALEDLELRVGGKNLELPPGTRDKIILSGRKHTLKIHYKDPEGTIRTVKKTFVLDFPGLAKKDPGKRLFLLNIPAFLQEGHPAVLLERKR